jgi:hypothetical protein
MSHNIRRMDPVTGTVQTISDSGSAFALTSSAPGFWIQDFTSGLFSDGNFVARPNQVVYHPTKGYYVFGPNGIWRLD